MQGHVIVSSEIEDIIDKENILGTGLNTGSKNVRIFQSGKELSGFLEKVSFNSRQTSLQVQISDKDFRVATGFLNRSEKKILLEDHLELKASEKSIESLSLYRKKDMYIWKIIIDNSE